MQNAVRKLIVFAVLVLVAGLAQAQIEAPYIYKTSLRLDLRRFDTYWGVPNASKPTIGQECWTPFIQFNIQGPVGGGDQLHIRYNRPDGSLWFEKDLPTPDVREGWWKEIRFDTLDREKQAIKQPGIYSVTVTMTNDLQKTKRILYTGKFEVVKFAWKDNFDRMQDGFYINRDWSLGIGQITFDGERLPDSPRLRARMWFRGDADSGLVKAFLYKDGQRVADGAAVREFVLNSTATNGDERYNYARFSLHFDTVASHFLGNGDGHAGYYYLAKNPGNYEIKVLRNGKLARTMTFTVTPDGKVTDGGLGEKNGMGPGVLLYPVEAVLDADAGATLTGYTKKAFYGNPVSGFPEK